MGKIYNFWPSITNAEVFEMSSDCCALEDIGSMDLSKYRKVTLQNGDGETVFLWSRYDGAPDHTEVPSLVLLSKDALSKDQLIKLQERLVSKGVQGGAWHVIDD
ncbi:hypothetical protein EMIT051CA3_60379 [Pseudomonas chlororaphis]